MEIWNKIEYGNYWKLHHGIVLIYLGNLWQISSKLDLGLFIIIEEAQTNEYRLLPLIN